MYGDAHIQCIVLCHPPSSFTVATRSLSQAPPLQQITAQCTIHHLLHPALLLQHVVAHHYSTPHCPIICHPLSSSTIATCCCRSPLNASSVIHIVQLRHCKHLLHNADHRSMPSTIHHPAPLLQHVVADHHSIPRCPIIFHPLSNSTVAT